MTFECFSFTPLLSVSIALHATHSFEASHVERTLGHSVFTSFGHRPWQISFPLPFFHSRMGGHLVATQLATSSRKRPCLPFAICWTRTSRALNFGWLPTNQQLYICYTAIHVYILYIYTCIDTLYIDISYISYISPKSISLEILHPDCQWVLVRPLDVWPHPSPG